MTLPRKTLAALAALLLAGSATAQEADAFLERVRACPGLGEGALKLSVIGLPQNQTLLSDADATSLRLWVEGILTASEAAQLSAARDEALMHAVQKETAGLTTAETEAFVRRAFEGEVAVFIVDARREDGGLTVRLRAITADASCKVTSAPMTVALGSERGAADVDRVVEEAVAALVDAAPASRRGSSARCARSADTAPAPRR